MERGHNTPKHRRERGQRGRRQQKRNNIYKRFQVDKRGCDLVGIEQQPGTGSKLSAQHAHNPEKVLAYPKNRAHPLP